MNENIIFFYKDKRDCLNNLSFWIKKFEKNLFHICQLTIIGIVHKF